MRKPIKLEIILRSIIVVLLTALLVLVPLTVSVSKSLISTNLELESTRKLKEKKEEETRKLGQELGREQEKLVQDFLGFPLSELKQDEHIVTDYLNTIFSWKNGQEYDEQRQILEAGAVKGSEELLKVIMPPNYRVPVPKELVGKIKDNDIDINGLKSKLVQTQLERLSWSKSAAAEVTYVAMITYQVYVNEADLSGDYKTTRDMVFTFKVSGTDDRKVTEVQYGFVQQ
ncbi:hypothetical protein E5983_01815 [Streptococcus danieliae]|uniref:Uncharacterized protein n=1 Tax=Streptococcus danieliae TaxID=747656 RepID=A0A7X3KBN7_9STRE|nr:hypothetical protein [Streptococcus danieliae]MVX58389.1 hypothetical protein [Streptococcus danieliae]NYS33695.1 hypothetical protein [Streptococcus danieliae]